jgi:hypothetical protein
MDPGTAALVLSTAVSAAGQLQAGANAQKAANFNAQVAFNNANAARLAAIEDGKRQKRLGMKRQGSRRASPGGSDKIDLLEDSALEEALEVQSIIHGGEVQAIGFENNARLEIARGKYARSSAMFGALTTVGVGAYTGFSSAASTPSTTLLGTSGFNPAAGRSLLNAGAVPSVIPNATRFTGFGTAGNFIQRI